jgi:hypothetical protein
VNRVRGVTVPPGRKVRDRPWDALLLLLRPHEIGFSVSLVILWAGRGCPPSSPAISREPAKAFQGLLGAGVLVTGLWAGLAWGDDGSVPLLLSGVAAGVIGLVVLVARPARDAPGPLPRQMLCSNISKSINLIHFERRLSQP